jgi:site-specific DNA recombinase
VGGTPVLGYDVDPRGGRLIVNEKEARRVREIFALYRKHRSLTLAVAELGSCGWTTKSWKSKRGLRHKGRLFTKASLRRLLINVIYAGKVEHRGSVYEGEHPAIVDSVVWEEVNAEFRERKRTMTDSLRTRQNALLAGILLCKNCERPMIATYAAKRGLRYRYYLCKAAQQNGWKSCPTKSVPATLIEDLEWTPILRPPVNP